MISDLGRLPTLSAPFPFGRFSGRGVDAALVEVEVVPSALAPRAQRLRVSAGARQFELSDRAALAKAQSVGALRHGLNGSAL